MQILSENREKLIRLAEMLLEKEVIFKEDLVEIFGPRPFPDPEAPLPDAAQTVRTGEEERPSDNPGENPSADTAESSQQA